MYYDITGVDLVELVREVYNLSSPQGLGFIHFTPDPLSKDEAAEYVTEGLGLPSVRVSLDYVKGRSCKFVVWEKNGKLFCRDDWFDHRPSQLLTLFQKLNIEPKHVKDME